MEFPGLGAKSELRLPAYATATATPDPGCVCDPHHSSRQRQILNPLSRARDRTHFLMDTNRVCYCWATTGTSYGQPFLMSSQLMTVTSDVDLVLWILEITLSLIEPLLDASFIYILLLVLLSCFPLRNEETGDTGQLSDLTWGTYWARIWTQVCLFQNWWFCLLSSCMDFIYIYIYIYKVCRSHWSYWYLIMRLW